MSGKNVLFSALLCYVNKFTDFSNKTIILIGILCVRNRGLGYEILEKYLMANKGNLKHFLRVVEQKTTFGMNPIFIIPLSPNLIEYFFLGLLLYEPHSNKICIEIQ